MDPLEQQLKRALERKEPSAGFADRVLARVREKPHAVEPAGWRGFPFLGRRAWRVALAGGLALVMLLGAGLAYRRRREQERLKAEEARAQLITALRIASVELNHASRLVIQPTRSPRQARE